MGKVYATSIIVHQQEKTNNITMEKNAEQKEKYLTLVFRYKELPGDKMNYGVSKFIAKVMSAIANYNQNRNSYDPCFDFWGAYIDPNDMDIDDQNDVNNKYRIG